MGYVKNKGWSKSNKRRNLSLSRIHLATATSNHASPVTLNRTATASQPLAPACRDSNHHAGDCYIRSNRAQALLLTGRATFTRGLAFSARPGSRSMGRKCRSSSKVCLLVFSFSLALLCLCLKFSCQNQHQHQHCMAGRESEKVRGSNATSGVPCCIRLAHRSLPVEWDQRYAHATLCCG